MSGVRWKHWCPLGCGKKVIFYKIGYWCDQCERLYTKQQLTDFKEGIKLILN